MTGRSPSARVPGRRLRVLGLAAALTVTTLLGACGAGGDEHPGETTVTPVDPGVAAADFAKATAADTITATRYLYPTTTGDRDDRQNWDDLFLPTGESDRGSVPLVILIHGGAWQAQVGADSFVTFARRLAERGLAVVNVEYRRVGSGGGWPTTFADVAAALDFIPQIEKANPVIDADDAVVVGHSAGAQLAMWAGTRHPSEGTEPGAKPTFRPTDVISLAGPLDMREAVKLGDDRIVKVIGGTPAQVPDRYAAVDPIQNIDPRTPTIAMAGTKDTVVPPVLSQNYVRAARADGADARFVSVIGVDHPGIVDTSKPAFNLVVETISRAAHRAASR